MNRSSSPSAEPAVTVDAAETDVYKPLLQTLSAAVAVADPATWECIFENERFFKWFPPDAEAVDAPLDQRIRSFDPDRARTRIENGRPYKLEAEVKDGARTIKLEIEISGFSSGGRELAVVECTDATKRKEAEYMLDSYARMAEKNTREVQREKERAEKLLLNIMPRAVFEEMKDFGSVTPQRFDRATILMLDFVGFTDMAVSHDPGALVSELNDLFSAFDRIVELFNCERMKTIGDAYMAVAGIPEETDDYAQSIARVALRMRRYLERRNTSHREPWLGRIGIASGPVVGSIVGVQKYVYDIFGPGVNLASRMETLSDPMQISIDEATYDMIHSEFICSDLGEMDVKGFGRQRVYSLDAEVPSGR